MRCLGIMVAALTVLPLSALANRDCADLRDASVLSHCLQGELAHESRARSPQEQRFAAALTMSRLTGGAMGSVQVAWPEAGSAGCTQAGAPAEGLHDVCMIEFSDDRAQLIAD